MRTIKIVLVLIALVMGGAATYVWSRWQPCSTARECYWSWKAFTSNADPMEGRLFRAINGGFTASTELVSFQVPISPTANGLLLIHRADRRAAVLAQDGYSYWAPRFSDDGERLVFARGQAGQAEQELVSCLVSDWRCTTFLRSTGSISSPVDIGGGKVLFALGYPVVRDGEVTRYRRYDFHIVSPGRQPSRMTGFDLIGLHAISVGKDKVYFSALGGKSESKAPSCTNAIKCDSSEIFSLDLDRDADRILNPPDKLKPAIMLDGLSVDPAISADGTRLAFLNTDRKGNPWRYNLKVAGTNGGPPRTIAVNGIAFSAAAFVGETLLVNELFKDRYRVSVFDRDLNRIDTIEVPNSVEFLNSLHRVGPTVASAKGGF
jgi:WD40-like Beta Propeller Repeat